jgi:hypothetical protein
VTFVIRRLIALLVVWAASASSPIVTQAQGYFSIQVRDSQTGRGFPLVKLSASNQDCCTYSNGYLAYNTPGLMNQNVAFFASSYRYGYSTLPLRARPGRQRNAANADSSDRRDEQENGGRPLTRTRAKHPQRDFNSKLVDGLPRSVS